MTNEPTHPAMDPAIVDELLEKLSTDDAFRDRFAAQPRQVLADLGHMASADNALLCATTTTLASKEEIANARAALRAHLCSHNTMAMSWVFCFEAGKIDQALQSS